MRGGRAGRGRTDRRTRARVEAAWWSGALALLLLAARGAAAVEPPCDPAAGGTNPRVEIVTTQGTLHVELLADRSPCTVENFLNYVARGDFDGSFFHRSVPGFIIQGGGFRFAGGNYQKLPTDPPVTNEFDPALAPVNVRGTVAMAKLGGDPNSATNQWFINLADNSSNLDGQNGGFTVFGQVDAADMAVADAIAALPTLDGRFAISTIERGAFTALPIASEVQEDPAGYGCFDFTFNEGFGFPVAGVLFSGGIVIPDPLSGVPIFISPACRTTPVAGVCTDPTSTVAAYRLETGQVVVNGTGNAVGWFMTCDAVEASHASLAARMAHVEPQLPERLVVLQQVTLVPEPSAGALRGGALWAIFGLLRLRPGRARDRNRLMAPSAARPASSRTCPR